MVKSQRAMYTGVNDIMNAFESFCNGSPYYSFWYGNEMRFQYNNADAEKGRRILEDILTVGERNGDCDLYTIRFYNKLDKGGVITNRTACTGSLPVRICDIEDNATISGIPETGGRVSNEVFYMMRNINEALPKLSASNEAIEARLLALEASGPVEVDMFDKISGILEKPGVTDLIGGVIGKILGFVQPQPNMQINGAPKSVPNDTPIIATHTGNNPIGHANDAVEFTESENLIIDDALISLEEHCDVVACLPALAKFAKDSPDMFKWLLTQLSSEK